MLIGEDVLEDVLVPETMIKSCWGKKLRGEKVREIWKPEGDERLPVCGLPDFIRFSGELCVYARSSPFCSLQSYNKEN